MRYRLWAGCARTHAHQCTCQTHAHTHTYIHTHRHSQTYRMSLADLTKKVHTLLVNGHLAGLALVSLHDGRGGEGRGGEERSEGELSLTYHCMSRTKT